MIDEGDDEDEVKYYEGLPVEHLHVKLVVQEVEPEAQESRIQEAVDLRLRLKGGMLVLQLEKLPEVQGAAGRGCGRLLLI